MEWEVTKSKHSNKGHGLNKGQSPIYVPRCLLFSEFTVNTKDIKGIADTIYRHQTRNSNIHHRRHKSEALLVQRSPKPHTDTPTDCVITRTASQGALQTSLLPSNTQKHQHTPKTQETLPVYMYTSQKVL